MGTMACESRLRQTQWAKVGCNAFDAGRPRSAPLSFWTEQDVLRFIVERGLPYASVYGDIVASDGENDYGATLIDCKLHCTGCQWCPSGSYSYKHGEQHKGMFTTDRAKNRAKTFPGIAKAMAEQWGGDARGGMTW